MANPTLVVMAAGIGSRYGGFKQMIPVGPGGESIIDYSIYDAKKAGFDKVVFIIGRDIEKDFREKIGRNIEPQIQTEYVFQDLDLIPDGYQVPADRAKPWGTGHAVYAARDKVNQPFGVINADDYYGASSFKIMRDFLVETSERDNTYGFCLIGYVLKNTLSENGHVARGVCAADGRDYMVEVNERLKIQRFDEGVKYEKNGQWVPVSEDSLVSMNMWGFTPGMFGELEERFPFFLDENINTPKAEYLLPEVVSDLVNERKATVKILPTQEKWYGITYQEDKPVIQQAIRSFVDKGQYPEKLWS